MTGIAPKDSPLLRPLVPLIALAIALVACAPATDDGVATTVEPSSTTSTEPLGAAPLAGTGGRLVVQRTDGSVALVDPAHGQADVIHTGDGSGAPVQATGAVDGSAVVWTMPSSDGEVGLWRDGTSQVVEAPFAPFFYAFSPDATKIAMLGNEGDEVGLAVLDLEAEDVESIDRGSPYFFDWHMGSSEVGAHIGSDFAGTVTLDGSRSAVAGVPGWYQAPDWVDRRRIVTVVQRDDVVAEAGIVPVQLAADPFGVVAVIDVGSGRTDRLVDVAGLVSFAMSPAGDRLAYIEADDPTSSAAIGALAVVDLVDGTPQVVSPSPVVAFEWSPSGDRLLYLIADPASGLVAPHVWDGDESTGFEGYFPTPVFVLQYLPFWDQYSRALTTWSPAGDAFAYAAQSAEGGEVWVQPLEGDRRSMGGGAFVSWIGSPDGGSAPVLP